MTETVRGIALARALVGRAGNVAYGEMVTVPQVEEAIARLCGQAGIARSVNRAAPLFAYSWNEGITGSLRIAPWRLRVSDTRDGF